MARRRVGWHMIDRALSQRSSAVARSSSAVRNVSRLCAPALLCAALLWPAPPALAQFTQNGPKLVGTAAVGSAFQGASVALSGDGHTAIVGGPFDNAGAGAVWVFTRSGGVWSQQGVKLVGIDAVGTAEQGWSVALSADGNTAIVGGPGDNTDVGAVWVFTRSGGTWSQQGAKLVGTGAAGNAKQGYSVALSADGNTAIVGGSADNSSLGAAWLFTRSGGVWSQQGAKLVGTGATGSANIMQGFSVALSGDGNTAMAGGPNDDSGTGAAWVFTRSGTAWSQQGAKLVGTPNSIPQEGFSVALSGDGNTAIVGGPGDDTTIGNGAAWVFVRTGATWSQQAKLAGTSGSDAGQGFSVALSGGGNTAFVGGPTDNALLGAVWVFTRSGAAWSQQGNKLVGTGAVGFAGQGAAVALSCSTAIVGGPGDNNSIGALWAFVAPSNATHDFNGDCLSDIAWRNLSGATAAWLMNGASITAALGVGNVPANWQLAGQRDFNGDGMYDFLWRDGTSRTVAIWLFNGLQVSQSGSLGVVPTTWSIVGTSDFNGDGKGDILWRDGASGTVVIWLLDGLLIAQSGGIGVVPSNWVVAGTDGNGHILWRDSTTGTVAIWVLNGLQVAQSFGLGAVPGNWQIVGVGDFSGVGPTSSDILWRDGTTASVAIWQVNNGQITQTAGLGTVPSNWSIVLTGDFNGDGKTDILWRDSTTGTVVIWFMNGVQVVSTASLGAVGTDWTIQAANAD